MRSINIGVVPSYTAAARSPFDDSLIILIALVTPAGDKPTNDPVRIPVNVAAPEGVDAIDAIHNAINNRFIMNVAAQAEWDADQGAWIVSRIDAIDDPVTDRLRRPIAA